MSIIVVVPDIFQSQHVTTIDVVGAVGALFLLATAFQWFRFVWTLGGWTCPRCRESFFHSTFVRTRLVVTVLIAIFADLPAPKSFPHPEPEWFPRSRVLIELTLQ